MNDATNASAGSATSSLGRSRLSQPPVDDHAHALREGRRVLEVVRDEQDRDAEPGEQVVQLGADRRLRVRVERRERLVEQQDLRVARERARERDALPLAAGELARPRVREVRDAKALEVVVRSVTPRVLDVLANRHVREERVLLEDEPDAPALRRQLARSPSNHTSSSTATRPDCGRVSPATMRSTVVLPAPDGPTSATVALDVERQAELEGPKKKGDLVESERCHERPRWRPARSTMLISTRTPLIASVALKFDRRTRRRSRAAASA